MPPIAAVTGCARHACWLLLDRCAWQHPTSASAECAAMLFVASGSVCCTPSQQSMLQHHAMQHCPRSCQVLPQRLRYQQHPVCRTHACFLQQAGLSTCYHWKFTHHSTTHSTHRKFWMPVVNTCSTTVSPGMMAAMGGAKRTRLGAARALSRRCLSTRCGLHSSSCESVRSEPTGAAGPITGYTWWMGRCCCQLVSGDSPLSRDVCIWLRWRGAVQQFCASICAVKGEMHIAA